ncbi:MAG: prepilin peptidase [Lachnospiraceae bacterium]|nr:prepilin peptidase [Lachnospiraceae bacterium]
MEELINNTLIMILLGICSYFDFKERKIPVVLIFLSIGLHIAFSVYWGSFSIGSSLAGLLLGAGLCLLSVFSKGALGIGDGLLAAACGISLGFYKTLALFFYGFLLTGLIGFFFLIGKKKSRKEEMPLVPFLYLVYGSMCFLEL